MGTARQRRRETRRTPPGSQLDEAGRGVSDGAGCPGHALLEEGQRAHRGSVVRESGRLLSG